MRSPCHDSESRPAGRRSFAGAGVIGSLLLAGSLGVSLVGAARAIADEPASTSAPARFDHDLMYKKVSETPLQGPVWRSASGRPLTDDQTKQIQDTLKVMDDARAARKSGDFSKAAELAGRALKTRSEIVGDKSYLTTEAGVLSTTMSQWAGVSEDRRKKLMESDARYAEAKSLYDAGKYAESLAAARACLAIREKQMTPDDPEVGAAYLAIGTVQTDLGELEQAELALSKALDSYSASYGTLHPQTARVLDRLGWLHVYIAGREGFRNDRPRKALDFFGRAVNALKSTVGETAETAESLDNRGTAQVYVGNQAEALDDKLRALFIRETVLGHEAKDTAVSISNLAWLYGELKEMDRVIPLRQEAYAIFKKVLPAGHPYLELEKGNLARDYIRQDKLDEGIKLFEEMAKADGGSDAPLEVGQIDRLAELGGIYLRAGRVDDAVKAFEGAYEKTRQLYDAGKTTDATNILLRVTRTCQAYRMYGDALKYETQLVAWDESAKDRKDTMDTAGRLAAMGILSMQVGKLGDADRMTRKAIERFQKVSGESTAELINTQINLATIYLREGKLKEARAECNAALQTAEARAGRNSMITVYALLTLGQIYAKQGQFEDAEFNLSEAKSICESLNSSDATLVTQCDLKLADCYRMKGDYEKAIAIAKPLAETHRSLAAKAKSDFLSGLLAENLHLLCEAGEAGGKVSPGDLEKWKAELKSILEKLESRRTITGDESDWLKKLR